MSKPNVTVYRMPLMLMATQWFPGDDIEGVTELTNCTLGCCPADMAFIETLEGRHFITPGYWVMTGVDGEHWGVAPAVFEKTYRVIKTADSEGFVFE